MTESFRPQCRKTQGSEICDLTFRVYNDTANRFLDGGMEVEDVDEALELAAMLAGKISGNPDVR